jgi:hypothetical protein
MKGYVQNSEFARLNSENACWEQDETDGKHYCGGDVEAAENEKAIPSSD